MENPEFAVAARVVQRGTSADGSLRRKLGDQKEPVIIKQRTSKDALGNWEIFRLPADNEALCNHRREVPRAKGQPLKDGQAQLGGVPGVCLPQSIGEMSTESGDARKARGPDGGLWTPCTNQTGTSPHCARMYMPVTSQIPLFFLRSCIFFSNRDLPLR